MKHIINSYKNYIFLAITVFVIGFATSCKKDTGDNLPIITAIRNYVAAPGDSLLTKVGPGRWVVITGSNLRGATQIFFDGVAASFNEGLFSDTTAVVLIPAVISFPTVPTAQLNTIRYVTNHGEVTFTFPINPPPPTITSVSNEYTQPGKVLTIYGNNLFFVDKVIFPGNLEVTTILSSRIDGTSITITVPAGLNSAGVLKLINRYGVATSIFSYNDYVTGVLCNFDNINTFGYYSGKRINDATLFPDNTGYYGEIYAGAIGSYSYDQANGRCLNINPVQWIPQANLNDTLANYGMKFEIFVKEPWGGAALMIRRDESSWKYLARYEPWKTSAISPFFSNTWYTVTIPLTEFRTKAAAGEGTGTSATSFTDLINATGNRGLGFMYINDQGSAVPTKFDVGIDNVRIVKIK